MKKKLMTIDNYQIENSLNEDYDFETIKFSKKNKKKVKDDKIKNIDQDSELISDFESFCLHENLENDKPYHEIKKNFSPIRKNSIFELTFKNDKQETLNNIDKKSQIVINNGKTVINIEKPIENKEISNTHLSDLKKKITNDNLKKVFQKFFEFQNEKNNSNVFFENDIDSYNSTLSDDESFKDLETLNQESENFFQIRDSIELSKIDNVFFNNYFRLDNPTIFKKVIPSSNFFNLDLNSLQSFTNDFNIAQEKYLNYLDIVEINLEKEIIKSYNFFFDTFNDIDELKKKVENCIIFLHSLNEKLLKIPKYNLKNYTSILELITKKKNMQLFELFLLQLQHIKTSYNTLQSLYKEKKNFECLEKISFIESLIKIKKNHLYDEETINFLILNDFKKKFVDLPALKKIKESIKHMKNDLNKRCIEVFSNYLLNDLLAQSKLVDIKDVLDKNKIFYNKTKKMNKKSSPINPEIKKQLEFYIDNLSYQKVLINAYKSYENKIFIAVENLLYENIMKIQAFEKKDIKKNKKEKSHDLNIEINYDLNSDYESDKKKNVLNQIKNLSSESFILLLKLCIAQYSLIFDHLSFHQKILLDLGLKITSKIYNNTNDSIFLDITHKINETIILTEEKVREIISIKLEVLANLTLSKYLDFYFLIKFFLQECEMINPELIDNDLTSTLSQWLNEHVEFFLHRFHQNSIKNLQINCENEIWDEYTDTNNLNISQKKIDIFIKLNDNTKNNKLINFYNQEWFETVNSLLDIGEESITEYNINNNPSLFKIKLDNNYYSFIRLSVIVLDKLIEYFVIYLFFSFFGLKVEINLLKYLKLLNFKTSQLILNAGATKTVGLKHITTKNITLCMQLLEFCENFIDFLEKKFILKHSKNILLNKNQQELTFSQMKIDFRNHQNTLQNKFLSIVNDKFLESCDAIMKIDWSENFSSSKQCHTFMEILVKDTIMVSKTLNKYCSSEKSFFILLIIFDSYKKSLIECFCKKTFKFKNENEKQLALKDIDYFRYNLSNIPGYGNSGHVIWENISCLLTEDELKLKK